MAATASCAAFVNVCRHRGHVVVEGSGCRETLQCPYHAWTYGLDGALRKAPRSEREPGFDPAAFSLLPVAVDTWGPFVFVNPDPDAGPLAEALGDVPEHRRARAASTSTASASTRTTSGEQEVNWKVALENYLECYHCPVAHPGFSKVIDVDPDSYRLQSSARRRRASSARCGSPRSTGRGKRAVRPERRGAAVAVSTSSSRTRRSTSRPARRTSRSSAGCRIGPRTTVEVTDYFFDPDESDERIQELLEWDSQVAEEDVALVLSVQRGLDSGQVPQGRLMRESEKLIADFQRRVYDAIS